MSANFIFEVLCIDPEDILNKRALLRNLSSSATLWNNREPLETRDKAGNEILKGEGEMTMSILNVDTSKILTELVEAAFVIRVESRLFEPLEPFRQRLLTTLRSKLKFTHIRVLQDDISSEIANQLYPKINAVENLLRRYLIKFFFQRVGLAWWEVTATPKMIEKVKSRQRNRSNQFSYLIDSDIEFADFDDLGLLIYKQSTGFNDPETVLSRLSGINSLEELEELKGELAGNYTKYFKTFFRDKNFEKLWKEMSRIRNKVAHQATFFHSELKKGKELSAELTRIITEAEKHIDEIVLSLKEKQAIHKAAASAVREEEVEAAEQQQEAGGAAPDTIAGLPAAPDKTVLANGGASDHDNRVKIAGPKVVGRIKLEIEGKSYHKTAAPGFRVITESEILDELHEALHLNFTTYVGLKWFVTQFLANKGFAIGTTYSLVNILIEQERIHLYDWNSQEGYKIKAIRLPQTAE